MRLRTQEFYNNISSKLELLAMQIKTNGKLNILDLHVHAEVFYRDLINTVYGWNLKVANSTTANMEAIDLIDEDRKICIQVTATNTKQKIEKTLEKDFTKSLSSNDFTMYFLFIAEIADNLRKNSFKNPHEIAFDATSNILDKVSILRSISQLEYNKYRLVNEMFENYFGNEIQPKNLNSNLAAIINILSKENLDIDGSLIDGTLNTYNINRKIEFNDLETIKETTINQYKIYYLLLDNIYEEYEKNGQNKRLSVFTKINSLYENELRKQTDNSLDIFYNITIEVEDYILKSANMDEMEREILEMCVKIIVVDAFVRCKIFENPEGYDHVITE